MLRADHTLPIMVYVIDSSLQLLYHLICRGSDGRLTGAMIPGQFGPTNLVLFCVFRMSVILTMSCWGMPSVIHTTSPISALIASSIPAAASGGGTKIALALAPVSFTASATVANTGLPRCSVPAFFGFVPPTTFVPYSIACCAWKEPYASYSVSSQLAFPGAISSLCWLTCLPVKPWNRTFVLSSIRKLTFVEAYPVGCAVAEEYAAEGTDLVKEGERSNARLSGRSDCMVAQA